MDGDIRDTCAKVFAVIDVHGRGTISRDQMVLALRMLNYNPIDSEIRELMEGDNYNTNNEYTYDQFVTFVTEKLELPSIEEQKLDIRRALALFDRSNTGLIDKSVFVAILTRLGEMKIDEKEAATWAEILDLHNDGKLRICELEEMFVNDEDAKVTLKGQQWDLV